MSRLAKGLCNRTGKVRYRDSIAAKMALATITRAETRARERSHKLPVRSFRCDYCSGYHLTSQTKAEYQQRDLAAQ